jgi:uncharacterized membrane protein YdbT with pleckstrin-like domain
MQSSHIEMNGDGSDENTVWGGHPAWSEYVFLWFFASIFAARMLFSLRMGQWDAGMIFGGGGVLFVAAAVYQRRSTRYRITREAVYRTKGILGKAEHRIPLEEIDSIAVERGVLDRLFGTGTLILHLHDGSGAGKRERLTGKRIRTRSALKPVSCSKPRRNPWDNRVGRNTEDGEDEQMAVKSDPDRDVSRRHR